MIIPPKNDYVVNKFANTNNELKEIKGEIDEHQAKIALAKFLRANLGFTCQMISGITLAAYQEIVLNCLFLSNYSMLIFTRGGAKSFLAAVFCYLYCIFNPNSKIIIAGPTFRTARFIFSKMEEIITSKEAELLEQCMPVAQRSRRNDMWEWEVNGGKIMAIPLAGEKIRGFRANILMIDEANWVDKDMIEKVLMPFLVSPQNLGDILKTKEIETELIRAGKMKEEERTPQFSDIKMILLSSAGYTFEYLYTLYRSWLNKILGQEEAEENIKYFIAQLAWNAIPEEMMDKTVIAEASKGGNLSSSFKMEYGAQFCDGSDSYFNVKKMEECTLRSGEYPHTLLRGDPSKKYVLSIDPNMSDAPNADYFAMAVLEIDEEHEDCILVHGYQGIGNFDYHVKYLTYILTHFKIHLIIGDSAGLDSFISNCNTSKEFAKYGFNLKYLDFNSCAENQEYIDELTRVKREYNISDGRIVIRQPFGVGDFLRKGNEHLQICIEYKKIWFASATTSNETAFNTVVNFELPQDTIRQISHFQDGKDGAFTTLQFVEIQDKIIKDTKKQCALIEHDITSKGNISFELPGHMARMNGPDKPRKDNYSALMLGVWGVKQYFAMQKHNGSRAQQAMFIPHIIR